MQRKKTALPSLPAAALWFPVPAVRAAPFWHSVCSCRFLSDGSGVGSARDLPLPVPAFQMLCSELHMILCNSARQSLLTTILCIWQWKRCCWWGTANLVPTIPELLGFQLPLQRKGLIRNLPNIQVTFFSGAFKLSKPCQMSDLR